MVAFVLDEETEPRPCRPVGAAVALHVLQDRFEQVDRHDHVRPRLLPARRDGVHEERADAEQPAVAPDERGAAPVRMRRGGEQGFVQHVFPVAGELALRDDAPGDGRAGAGVPGDDHRVAHVAFGARPELDGRSGERLEGLDEPEAGFLVGAHDVPGHGAAGLVGEPHGLRLGHEVADGQYEAGLADHHAATHALGPQHRRGERVIGNLGAHAHERRQHRVDVEIEIRSFRGFRHRRMPSCVSGQGKAALPPPAALAPPTIIPRPWTGGEQPCPVRAGRGSRGRCSRPRAR